MQILTLFFPALASFLFHVEAGPLTSRDNVKYSPATGNKPVCSGASSPAGTDVSMQTYCVNTIGAACATVVVFPEDTMSGNPGNCGNACSCTNSQCPAVISSCLDPSCLGDPNLGCSIPGAIMGCNCTGPAFSSTQSPPASQKNATVFNNNPGVSNGREQCPPSIPCDNPSCQSEAEGGAQVQFCVLTPFKDCPCRTPSASAKCPSDIYCSDPGCEGSVNSDGIGGSCRTVSSSGCPCNLWL